MTRIRDHIIFLFIIGGSLAIISQNQQERHLPCLVAIIALVAERLAREAKLENLRTTWRGLFAAAAFFLFFVVQPIVQHSVALARHFEGAMQTPMQSDLPEALARIHVASPTATDSIIRAKIERLIAEGNFEELRKYKRPELNVFQVEYLHIVLDGVDALRSIDLQDKSVITLDLCDPFQFILGLTPLRGHNPTQNFGRTFNRDIYISPHSYFAEADIVMAPNFKASFGFTGERLWEVYGDYVRAHYRVQLKTEYWTVWSKTVAGE